MANTSIKLNFKALDDLARTLKKAPDIKAKVGILGSTDARPDGTSNSEVGAAHEFGAPARNLPVRSFLRVPLLTHLGKAIEHSESFKQAKLDKAVAERSLSGLMEEVAILAEAIVKESFTNGGDGQWQGWKDPNYTNNTGMILDDTGELKNSITSEVKE